MSIFQAGTRSRYPMTGLLFSGLPGVLSGILLAAGAGHADNPLEASRTVPDAYRPGVQLTVSLEIEYTGSLSALGVREVIPAGWIYVSAGGANPPLLAGPDPGGEPHELDFAWFQVPASPVAFTYSVHVPLNETGAKAIEGEVFYRFAEGEEECFSLSPSETMPAYTVGDINNDGRVDIEDVIVCLKMAAGLPVTIGGTEYGYPYPPAVTGAADANIDGRVDPRDALLIYRKALGLD